jgi:hypothetical protein
VCGDADLYFPRAVYDETARLIPDCTLRVYEGVGHVGAVRDKRAPRDILEFVRQRPPGRRGTDAGETTAVVAAPPAVPGPSLVGTGPG